jgi:hypothetical protein
MFIKPDLSEDLRWQLMHHLPSGHSSFVLHYFDPNDPFAGNTWEHHPEIQAGVTGPNSYVMEVRVPFWKELDKKPARGDVWGVQLQLNRLLGGRKTPYWLYHWTYDPENDRLWSWNYRYGRWIFE